MNQFRLDLDATRCAQAHQQLCTAFPKRSNLQVAEICQDRLKTLKAKWLDLGGSLDFWQANVRTIQHAEAYIYFAFGPNSLRNN
jgi:hypothetical protein